MSQGKLIVVSTVAASQFRAAILQNASAELNFDVKSAGLGQTCDFRLKGVRIISVENLDWEIQLYRMNLFDHPSNPDLDKFAGRWSFVAADAVRVGAAGLYHYYIDGNDIEYFDEDQASQIHLLLVNRSAAGKSAGDAGAIRVELVVEPGLGR